MAAKLSTTAAKGCHMTNKSAATKATRHQATGSGLLEKDRQKPGCPAWDYDAYAPGACKHAGDAHSPPQSNLITRCSASPPGQGGTAHVEECSIERQSLQTRRLCCSESDAAVAPRFSHSQSCVETSDTCISQTASSPIKVTPSSSGRPRFTIGPDPNEDPGSGSAPVAVCSNPQKCTKDRDGHKSRFKKILSPLHRSHSAGSAKDLPQQNIYIKKKMEGENSVSGCDGHMSSEEELSSQAEKKDPGSTSNSKKKKTFTQDVKEKLSFLRRRHTETTLTNKMAEPKITADSLIVWSQSIDNLLNDRNGLDMFREFLRTEFSDENLEFWIACNEYRQLKSSKMPAQANKIYTDFVTIQAAREINLDSKTRLQVKDNMSHPNKHTFEEAQRKIQGLMEKDSYPRFLNSDSYQKLLREYKVSL